MSRTAQWVLLSYRLPREPSTPRIAVWRKLGRLGDGLVGLPADRRTREHFDWIAEEIIDTGGAATIWLAVPGSQAQEQAIARAMQAARAAEYRAVIAEARAASGTAEELAGSQRRLRAELRRIERRDFFPPPERDEARLAVAALGDPANVRLQPEVP